MHKPLSKIFLILFSLLSAQVIAQNNFTFEKKISNENYFENRELNILVYKNENLQFKFTKTLLPYQSIPEISVLNNGNVLLVHSQEGIIEFYNSSQLLNKYLLYQTHQNNEQSLFSSASNNDVGILISEKGENKINFYSLNGTPLDSTISVSGNISGFAYSPEGIYLATSIYSWENKNLINSSILLNRKSNKSIQIDEIFSKGSFNKGETKFLGFSNNNAFLIDLNTDEILWENKSNKGELFLDGTLENNKTLLIKSDNPKLELGNWVYSNIKVVSKNIDGFENIIKEINSDVRHSTFNKTSNSIFLNVDGENIDLGF